MDPRLGPFYETHGAEIIPLGYEEAAERLAEVLGDYQISSNIPSLNGISLTVAHYDLTRFVQEDWDRVIAGNSPRGFLLAARSASYAAGRVAEEVIAKRIFRGAAILGEQVEEVLYFWEACDRGLARRIPGVSSDDIILLLSEGALAAVEVKATFRGGHYIRRALPKVESQLRAAISANRAITLAFAVLIDITRRSVAVAGLLSAEALGGALRSKVLELIGREGPRDA